MSKEYFDLPAVNDNYISEKKNVLTIPDDVETVNGELVLDQYGNRILRFIKSLPDIDFKGVLDRAVQVLNLAHIAGTIEKGAEYVVKIPTEYQKQFAAGDLFINKNTKTGIEWPSLMRKAENGQYRFVDNLPIEKKEFIKGNPLQDICNSYHNIVMQQQLAQIANIVGDTYETVKVIELGQQDDRIARIESGKKQIMLAMSLQNEEVKKNTLRDGLHDLFLGREQVGKALTRRAHAFKSLPDNKFTMFLTTVTRPGYLSKKDDEVEEIQECYSLYVESTKMMAAVYAYMGETGAVEQTFQESTSFLQGIDFSSVKTIERSHEGVDFEKWFFNHPVEYVEAEKAPYLEAAKGYDFLEIEVTGEELLEVIGENGEISETDAK